MSKIRRTRETAYGGYSDWHAISEAIKARDGYKCTKCGNRANKQLGISLEAHHIIPVSRGGRTVSYNLRTLCNRCHGKMPFHNHLR